MKKRSKVFHAVLFLVIGIIFFQIVQEVMTPRWVWPQFKESTENTLAELETLEGSDIQAFFLGSSNSVFSIDPMRIYIQSGITTFNLSTSAQPVELSYYVLAEGFKYAKPNVVLLEASGLFPGAFESSRYHYVMDSMPLSTNKIGLAEAYSEHFPEEKRLGEFIGAFFPIYQYHDRWTELYDNDFRLSKQNLNYYTKGHYLNTITNRSGMNVPWMDDIARINATTDGWTEEIEGDSVKIKTDSVKQYNPSVDQNNLEMILRIKELCEANGAELRLIKVPKCIEPQYFGNAWTKIKSDIAKNILNECGMPFLDLMYDVDIGIDWDFDSCDNGNHLNFDGAKKVTDFLVNYLADECGLKGQYNENYESDIPIYSAVTQVAELQMTRDLTGYLECLTQMENVTVFIAASDDMMRYLSPENQSDLNRFGLRTNFGGLAYSDSYLISPEQTKIPETPRQIRPNMVK